MSPSPVVNQEEPQGQVSLVRKFSRRLRPSSVRSSWQNSRAVSIRRKKQGTTEWDVRDHIRGAIYGNCIGDAIGLLTEFMTKDEANRNYGKQREELEYSLKVQDIHRDRWSKGDWTDDSDQMILLLLMLLNKEKVDVLDFGQRLKDWAENGFPELGDQGESEIDATTSYVLSSASYNLNPHQAAEDIWRSHGQKIASNGAVMRTSILGAFQFYDIEKVIENTLEICKVTHVDPRCQASCVAVTTTIAFMLQRNKRHIKINNIYNIKAIMDDSYDQAKKCLDGLGKKAENELHRYMFADSLEDLELDEWGKIGYTYKTLGAGFWALRQEDFQKALQEIVMEAGDADTNCAVAGALLGCKLGVSNLPTPWLEGLLHKAWLDKPLDRFCLMVAAKEDEGNSPRKMREARKRITPPALESSNLSIQDEDGPPQLQPATENTAEIHSQSSETSTLL